MTTKLLSKYRVLGWGVDKEFVDETYLSLREAVLRFSEFIEDLGEIKYEIISKNQFEGGYDTGYCRVELQS